MNDDLKWTAVLKRHIMNIVVLFFCLLGAFGAWRSNVGLTYIMWPLITGVWVILAAMKDELIYIQRGTQEISDEIIEVQERTIAVYERTLGLRRTP